MRILSPLVSHEEVTMLVDAGADEFYCGLVQPGGAVNDRPNDTRNNFEDASDLRRAVNEVQRQGKKIFLALNKPALDLPAAVKQARMAADLGMHGLIVSNVLLIRILRDMHLDLELSASCLCAVFNSASVAFFRELGIGTFHLPRQLGLEQLRMIRQEYPDARLSVFGMRGMCMNVEAFCLLHHLKKDFFIPCKSFRVTRVTGSRKLSKASLDRKITMPQYSCAMCALRGLKKMGIYSIKIEGRNATAESKMAYVSAIRAALLLADKDSKEKEYYAKCRKLFKECFHEACCSEFCYY